MRRNRLFSYVMALILTGASLCSSIPTSAAQSQADNSIAVVTDTQLSSPFEGLLEIKQTDRKTKFFSGQVEKDQTFAVSGLSEFSDYIVSLQRVDGRMYYGSLQVYRKNNMLYGAFALDEIVSDERSVRGVQVQYESESNDSIKKANTVSENTIYGRIDKKLLFKDVDYFKIVFPSSGDYAIVLDNMPVDKDYDLYVYNANGKQVASSTGTSEHEIVRIEDVAADDVYYAKVVGYGKNDYGAVETYRLQYALFIPSADDYGNSFDVAEPVQADNTAIKGRIDYVMDVDYFVFTASVNGEYTISTEGNTDTYGLLYGADRKLMTENDDGDNWNFRIEKELTGGQQYYVAVKHYGAGTGEYTLYINAPHDDSGDSQNAGSSFDMATPLEVNLEKAGWFAGVQDARYFAFTPTESGSYGIYTMGGALDTYGTLYKSDRTTVVTENDNSGDGNHFLLANTLLAGQTYYLRVTAHRYNAAANQFTVHVKQYTEPNDSEFYTQYSLLNTDYGIDSNVLPAWEQATGVGILVAVADTGIDYNHADLQGNLNLMLSYNFTHSINDIFPDGENISARASAAYGHGTHVAGIIGASANNGTGVVGIAPQATLVGYKVMGTSIAGNPNYTGSITAFVDAIKEAQAQGIRIMNCSFGGAGASALELEAMENATDILFVVSAGNYGNDLAEMPEYPACYYLNHSMVVAFVDNEGQLDSDSNYGGPTEIAAQGTAINNTVPYGLYGEKSGTSMAAPVVTGVSALVMSKYPSLMPLQIKTIVVNNVTLMPGLNGKVSSMGMVNAFKAVCNDERETEIRSVDLWQPSRNPFSSRDIKSVVTEIKNTISDSEKTGNLIVKIQTGVDLNQFLEIVAQDTFLPFSFVKSTGIENAFELQSGSIAEADQLVDVFNSYDEVVYAEPNYIRQ